MFIRISRFACTEVKDPNGEDDNVWPFTFLGPEPVLDENCIVGEASAWLFDRKPLFDRMEAEEK